MALKKTAAERLQSAKAEIKRCEQKIDTALEHRREVLRREDAASLAAIRADEEIAELKLLRLRYIDQAELLGPSVAQESSAPQWPTDLASAQTALTYLEPRLRALQAVRPVDRSAAHDREIDLLVRRQYSLRKLVISLQPSESA